MDKDPHDGQLETNSIGLTESTVMGVAGTAPAYSIAATSAVLIGTVGNLAAGSLLYCGIIMFGITLAYKHLNRIEPNAGAAYAWVGEIFHPVLGFFAGWALLVASAIFMVSGTIPAATATLAIFQPALVDSTIAVPAVAAFWLLLIGAIVLKGIKLTSCMQIIFTAVEVGILLILLLAGGYFYIQYPQQVHPFQWSWLSVTAFTPQSFASGALIALFFFWGWDVTLNLNEESKEGKHTPGRAALVSMIIVLLLFMSFAILSTLLMTDEEIKVSGTNIVFAVAEKLLPRPWSYMAIVAVMLSTLGTLETTILQFTRTMFAKARMGDMHEKFALLHKEWKTPWLATALIICLGLIFLFASTFYPSVNLMVQNLVNAISFQVAFYYSLTGFASAWFFRFRARQSMLNFLWFMLWPFLSSLFLVFIVFYSMGQFDWSTSLIGIGGIAVGIFPYLWYRLRPKPHPK